MPVKLKDSSKKLIPAVELDKLHIISFVMQQTHPRNLVITTTGRRYGIDENNNHIFDHEVIEAHTDNADLDIATYSCSKRKISVEQFHTDCCAALDSISVGYQDGKISEAQIMAHMELGMALIFEIKGKTEILGTEKNHG